MQTSHCKSYNAALRAGEHMLCQAFDTAVVRYLRSLQDAWIIDPARLVGFDAERLEQDRIAALVDAEVVGRAPLN
jgi:hypothetical protein